jgi:diguanylate cyclase (GGDEF)-like protein
MVGRGAAAVAALGLLAVGVLLRHALSSHVGLGALVLLAWLGLVSCAAPAAVWLIRRGAADPAVEADAKAAELAQRQVELFRAARQDVLTGLQSRIGFLDTFAARLNAGVTVALVLVDVDKFSRLISVHGDSTGDEVLRVVADRLRTVAGQRDRAARLGADEFALLLERPEDLEDIKRTAAALHRLLSVPYPAAGELLDLSLSLGIACAPQHGQTADTLYGSARDALQETKKAGGNGWRICGQDHADVLRLRDRFRDVLSSAIDAGEIVPYYQSIVRLPEGGIARFEVLARWKHSKLAVLNPDQFIPLAEELGLTGRISMALLRQVALDTQDWPQWCRLAINVSAGQLRDLIGFFREQPGDWQRRMDLSRLDVEITEPALVRDRAMVRELIEALHRHGARAVLDNFGCGYSNLFHLRDMDFDSIKIGKGFVTALLDDPRAEACVTAMLSLGHGLNIDMVADGVENHAIAERLSQLGCNFAQGFLYAHPGPAFEARRLLNLPETNPVRDTLASIEVRAS